MENDDLVAPFGFVIDIKQLLPLFRCFPVRRLIAEDYKIRIVSYSRLNNCACFASESSRVRAADRKRSREDEALAAEGIEPHALYGRRMRRFDGREHGGRVGEALIPLTDAALQHGFRVRRTIEMHHLFGCDLSRANAGK